MATRMTIIRVRRGINGFPYAACDEDGGFIRNFNRLADVRNHWKKEIQWGYVKLIRELDKQPDMSKIEAAKEAVESMLQMYAQQNASRRQRREVRG